MAHKEFSRVDRLSQQLQKELAVILQREIKDPRLHTMITVSQVDVSRDLSYAKIYVTFLGLAEDKIKDNLKILNDAKGFIRSLIGKRIQTRIVPQVQFYYDSTLDEGIRLTALVESARRADEAKRPAASTEDEPAEPNNSDDKQD
ncbi:30S ribosome-binding factor RbfA [Alkalimonas delamerensis]|uniref:Ribosome-binding factor A n=1 Tax=Alkalimonas delamerensis TaxID=265981 RepID=A0ABT9GSF4_9GAMM|nr:30S ribosome-binding factor RbfA [Alkalimonas delamerensis]MDP4529824.1 30S ribosome-binding factor RbfA [Alkalimonas delamerensis]